MFASLRVVTNLPPNNLVTAEQSSEPGDTSSASESLLDSVTVSPAPKKAPARSQKQSNRSESEDESLDEDSTNESGKLSKIKTIEKVKIKTFKLIIFPQLYPVSEKS